MNYYKLPLDKKIGMAELAIENSRRSVHPAFSDSPLDAVFRLC